MLSLADNPAADEITLLGVTHHLRTADAAEGPQSGNQVNGFEDIGLALRVVSEQEMETRRKIDIQPSVISEIAEAQVGQMHRD
jgi:hypothetical protein